MSPYIIPHVFPAVPYPPNEAFVYLYLQSPLVFLPMSTYLHVSFHQCAPNSSNSPLSWASPHLRVFHSYVFTQFGVCCVFCFSEYLGCCFFPSLKVSFMLKPPPCRVWKPWHSYCEIGKKHNILRAKLSFRLSHSIHLLYRFMKREVLDVSSANIIILGLF